MLYEVITRKDGTVWAWGNNDYGQLGDGTRLTRWYTPKQVPGLDGVVAVSTSPYHSLALRQDGTVWGWGSNWNGSGVRRTTHRITSYNVCYTKLLRCGGAVRGFGDGETVGVVLDAAFGEPPQRNNFV